MRRLAAIVVTGTALAGCGSSGGSVSDAPGGNLAVVPGATGRMLNSPWTLIAVHGRRIKISAQHEGCTNRFSYQFDPTTVTQTSGHVTIAVYDLVTAMPKGYACPAQAIAPLTLTVRLQAPLGRRALVHAPVAPQAPTGP